MKQCIYCGAELPDEAKACSNCGRPLPMPEQEQEPEVSSPDTAEAADGQNSWNWTESAEQAQGTADQGTQNTDGESLWGVPDSDYAEPAQRDEQNAQPQWGQESQNSQPQWGQGNPNGQNQWGQENPNGQPQWGQGNLNGQNQWDQGNPNGQPQWGQGNLNGQNQWNQGNPNGQPQWNQGNPNGQPQWGQGNPNGQPQWGQGNPNGQNQWNQGMPGNQGGQAPWIPQGYGMRTQSQHLHGMAVASMILGILSLFLNTIYFIPSLLAIGFGIASLMQIRRSPQYYRGSGLAIAGIILGAVFLIIYVALFLWAAHMMRDPEFMQLMQQYMEMMGQS